MDSNAPNPAQDRPVHANILLIQTTIKKGKSSKTNWTVFQAVCALNSLEIKLSPFKAAKTRQC
jgi:hypothetical protein